MRKRKTKKSDLEGKKSIFFQIGLIIALLAVLYAFDFRTYEKYSLDIPKRGGVEIPTDFVLRTKHVKPPPVKKPVINIIIDLTDKIDDGGIEIDISDNTEEPIKDWEPFDEPEPVIIDDTPVFIAEEMPSFPGGYASMMKFISQNIKYPMLAKEANISGTVYIGFVIEKDGTISNIVLLREIGGGCDEEAIRVVSLMPKWNCGKQNGRPVRVKLTLPIKFSLL